MALAGDGAVSRNVILIIFFILIACIFGLPDGMFAILIPATLSPLVATLLWAEWRAKKIGIVGDTQKTDDDESTLQAFPKRAYNSVYEFLSRLDAFGLLLLGTAVSLILLPLTLARTTAKDGWHNRVCLFFARRLVLI